MTTGGDLIKAEKLAANLARGAARPYWVVRVFTHYFVIPKPCMSDLAQAELKGIVLPHLGCSFEGEYDKTGAKI